MTGVWRRWNRLGQYYEKFSARVPNSELEKDMSIESSTNGAVLREEQPRVTTYRDAVYSALEQAKKHVAELENLKLIVDATPALGQLHENSVRYPGGSF